MDRGKLVIVGMFVVGLAAATFTVWFRYTSTKQALRFWGVEATMVILNGPQVELLKLGSPIDSSEIPAQPGSAVADSLLVGGVRFVIVARADVAADVEFPRLRRKLVEDASYQWNDTTDPSANKAAHWNYALRFVDVPQVETLAFALDDREITQARDASGASLRLTPLMRDELDLFIKEELPPSP